MPERMGVSMIPGEMAFTRTGASSSAVCLFPVLSLLSNGVLPILARAATLPWTAADARQWNDRMVRQIPPDAAVIATFGFQPKLAFRQRLYSLHHVYTGHYTLSDKPYPTPEAEYLLMDTTDRLTFSADGFYAPENYRRLQACLAQPGWRLVDHVGPRLLFRRSPDAPSEEPGLVRYGDTLAGACSNLVQSEDVPARLVGFVVESAGGDMAALDLFWRKDAECPDFDVELAVRQADRVIWCGTLAPGSPIWPPQSWPTGSVVADRQWKRCGLRRSRGRCCTGHG